MLHLQVVPGAHLPFGDGARKCIGFRFALMEATLTLVKLYQQVGLGTTGRGAGACRASHMPHCLLPASCGAAASAPEQAMHSQGAPALPATLQYTFRLLPGQQPLKVRTLLTMGPEGGVRVTVHRRS